MKRWVWIAAVALLLSGCGVQQTYETVMDVWQEQEIPEPRAISVDLPGETALPVMESDSGRAYVASDYEIYIQTMPGGDLGATMEAMSGYRQEDLTVMTTLQEDATRYEFVWASAGEGGDFLGRGVILDDGHHHYTMSVLRNADTAQKSAVVWDSVFTSFRLA